MHQPPRRSPEIDDGSRSILTGGRGGDRQPNAAASASGDQAGGAAIWSRETRFGHWPPTRPGLGWFVMSVDFVDCGLGSILRHSHATIIRLAVHYLLYDQEDGAAGELRSKAHQGYGVAKLRNSGIGEWTDGLISLAESSQVRQRGVSYTLSFCYLLPLNVCAIVKVC
ncbi:hypothetical protein Drorol1_Dr00001594 [Drosera rotundifolia]